MVSMPPPPRQHVIYDLAMRLIGELEVARREGATTDELGGAIGFMLGQMVPDKEVRDQIEEFASRHTRAPNTKPKRG